MKTRCLAAFAVSLLLGAGGAKCASLDDLAQRLISADAAVSTGALRELPPLPQADRQELAVKLGAQFRPTSKEYNWGDHVRNINIEHALAELGSDAAPAVPALVAAIHNAYNTDGGDDDPRDEYYDGFKALARIGAPAVPALRGMLKVQGLSEDAEGALGWIGPAASAALPDLYARLAEAPDAGTAAVIILIGIDGLTREQRALVFKAAIPVAELDGPIGEAFHKFSAEAFPIVQGVLNSEEAAALSMRGKALVALGATGLATAPEAAKVMEMVKSKNSNVETLGYEILTRLGPNARSVLPEIEKLIIYEARILGRNKFFVNEKAVALADAIAPEALDAWLAGQVADGENCAALTLAAGRGPKFRGAALQLAKQALKDQCGGVHDVVHVLESLAGDGAAAITFILQDTNRQQKGNPEGQCEALGKIGPQAEPAIPDIVVAIRRRKASGDRFFTSAGREVNSCRDALYAIGTPAAREAAKEFEAGEQDKQIAAYSKALSLDPKSARAFHNRGLAFAKKGRYYEAINDYSRVIELDPKNSGVFHDRGLAYAGNGDYGKAIGDYSRAIAIDPKDAGALHDRGLAYAASKEYDKAIEDYSKLIKVSPKNARAYHDRGLSRQWKGDHDKAIEDYSRAIELDQKDETAYYDRGGAFSGKGGYEKAIGDYSKALELNPKFIGAYVSRALAYEKLGKPEEADKDCAKAVEIDPSPIKVNPCYELDFARMARKRQEQAQKELLEKFKARSAKP